MSFRRVEELKEEGRLLRCSPEGSRLRFHLPLPRIENLFFEDMASTSAKRKQSEMSKSMSLPVDWRESLNTLGCFAEPLPLEPGVAETSIRELNFCYQTWLDTNIEHILASTAIPVFKKDNAPDQVKITAWVRGKSKWEALDPNEKQAVRLGLDMHHCPSNIFDATTKKKFLANFPFMDEDMQIYIRDIIDYVIRGNSRMAQGTIEYAFLQNGFGLNAYMNPDSSISAALSVRSMLRTIGFGAYLSGLPHLIYKPPLGASLAAHHDGFNVDAIIPKLEAFMNENGPQGATMEKLAGVLGTQTLVHMDGGYEDGYTYGFNLTPARLLVCFKAVVGQKLLVEQGGILRPANGKDLFGKISDVPLFLQIQRWATAAKGPHFLNWGSLLDAFTRELRKPEHVSLGLKGEAEDSLELVPIRPAEFSGPYIAVWVNGFPHGSGKNSSRRITFTSPVKSVPSHDRDARVPIRIKALSVIDDETSLIEEREAAISVIKGQTREFEQGPTHRRPESVLRYVGPGNPFHPVGILPATADAFQAAWDEDAPPQPAV